MEDTSQFYRFLYYFIYINRLKYIPLCSTKKKLMSLNTAFTFWLNYFSKQWAIVVLYFI